MARANYRTTCLNERVRHSPTIFSAQEEGYLNASRIFFDEGGLSSTAKSWHKSFHSTAKLDNILDVPHLLEDDSLNLDDSGSNNVQKVALEDLCISAI